MINMKMTSEEQMGYAMSTSIADQPAYPYGLRIDLNDAVVDKLGIKELPKVGDTMLITARVKVVSASESEEADGDTNKCMGLQITDMELGADKSEPVPAKKALYGG